VDAPSVALLRWAGVRRRFWLQLAGWLIEALIKVLRIEVKRWDVSASASALRA